MAEEKLKEETEKKREIPEKKIKAVDELANLIKGSRSFMIVSIKNLPSKQLQLIKRKLKDKAIVKVVKKNISSRAINKIEKGAIKNFKKYLKEDQALIFSILNPFELSAILSKNKSKARAKIDQVVSEDVVIEEGPTELVPGPIISELGSLGIEFAVEDGKINIRKRKVILKEGEEVNESQASIMSKLDIKPIAVGLEPIVAYDSEEDKIYEDVKIDIESAIEELKVKAEKALAFAVKIYYICKETIGFLIRKAASEEKILESKMRYEKEGIKTTPEEIEQAKKAIDDESLEKVPKEESNIQQNKSEDKEEN